MGGTVRENIIEIERLEYNTWAIQTRYSTVKIATSPCDMARNKMFIKKFFLNSRV